MANNNTCAVITDSDIIYYFTGQIVEDSYLVINSDKQVDLLVEDKFKQGVEFLKKGMPLQYITNNQEFMKLNFYVDSNVLIPQPDTEILVEEVINEMMESIEIEERKKIDVQFLNDLVNGVITNIVEIDGLISKYLESKLLALAVAQN